MQEYMIRFEQIPWETPFPGLRTKTVRTSGKQVRLVEYSLSYTELEWCENQHTGFILSGELEIVFEKGTILLGSGDPLVIPPGAQHKHKARALSDRTVLFLSEDRDV